MLAIRAYYAGIMLNAFATYYAHNYAGTIGPSLIYIKFIYLKLRQIVIPIITIVSIIKFME